MEKIHNYPRLIFSIGYFVVGFVIVGLLYKEIFYLEPRETYNFFRFLWCIACSLLGFSVLACRLAFTPPMPPPIGPYISTIPSYITYYPFMLIVVSSLSFSVFNAIDVTSGYIFYYASFALCFILGYFIDGFWHIVEKIIEIKK